MKKRILFILHLPPPVHGAAMVGQFIRESETINEKFDCCFINYTTASSLQDIGGGGFAKLKRIFRLYSEVYKAIKTFKPDLVYITPNSKGGAFYIKDVPIVAYIKIKGIKIIAHYHNKGVAQYQNRWIDNFLYKRFFKGIKVILLADALYDDMKNYVRRDDVYICPNGIPKPSNEVENYNTNQKVTLLFLSNLLINKGVLTLLDSLKILKERGKVFSCLFVGGETSDFNEERFYYEVKKRGLEEYVTYKGRLYGSDKDYVFGQSDIFILPSYDEAFPLVNLEAMSFHLPVVSTRVGGILEAVVEGKNGFLCDPRDVQGLSNCIEKLIDNPILRKEMGEIGYDMFTEHFTNDAFIARLDVIINHELNNYIE